MEENAYIILTSYTLIIASLLIAKHEGLDNKRDIFLSSLRTLLQLIALGYLLKYLLDLNHLWEIMGVLTAMCGVSAFIAYERIRVRRVLITSFWIMLITFLSSTLLLLLLGVLKPSAHQLIPFGGLIIGNTLNSVSLSFDRLVGEVRGRIEEIEAMVALGSPLRDALRESFKNSIKASLIPKINFMKAAGVVHIPGVAVGMLIAGADPMEAIVFQVVILYSLVFAGMLGSVLMVYMNYRVALYLSKKV